MFSNSWGLRFGQHNAQLHENQSFRYLALIWYEGHTNIWQEIYQFLYKVAGIWAKERFFYSACFARYFIYLRLQDYHPSSLRQQRSAYLRVQTPPGTAVCWLFLRPLHSLFPTIYGPSYICATRHCCLLTFLLQPLHTAYSRIRAFIYLCKQRSAYSRVQTKQALLFVKCSSRTNWQLIPGHTLGQTFSNILDTCFIASLFCRCSSVSLGLLATHTPFLRTKFYIFSTRPYSTRCPAEGFLDRVLP